MLSLWAALWKHSPIVANTSLAQELRDAGATDGGAIGVNEPRHAEAALASLARQGHEMIKQQQATALLSARGPTAARIREYVANCTLEERAAYIDRVTSVALLDKPPKYSLLYS